MTILTLAYDMRAPDFDAPPAALYKAALDQCEWADALGFKQVLLMENHATTDPRRRDPEEGLDRRAVRVRGADGLHSPAARPAARAGHRHGRLVEGRGRARRGDRRRIPSADGGSVRRLPPSEGGAGRRPRPTPPIAARPAPACISSNARCSPGFAGSPRQGALAGRTMMSLILTLAGWVSAFRMTLAMSPGSSAPSPSALAMVSRNASSGMLWASAVDTAPG